MKKIYIKIGILILIIALLSILGWGYINHKEADLTRENVLEYFENNNDMFDEAVKKLKQHSDRYQIYNDGTYEGDYKDKNILDFMRITKCEEIKKTEDLIIFAMNSLSADGGNYCFCGIYYSANDKPHIVEYSKNNELEKHGDGWSMSNGDEYSNYYTENIENHFYYYEGIICP